MNIFGEKVKYELTFWKELLIGAIEGILWCVVLFLLIFNKSEDVILFLQNINDNVEDVWSLFAVVLPIFVVISVSIKLALFTFKMSVSPAKKTAKTTTTTTAKKTVAKKTTAKKTTKKAK